MLEHFLSHSERNELDVCVLKEPTNLMLNGENKAIYVKKKQQKKVYMQIMKLSCTNICT